MTQAAEAGAGAKTGSKSLGFWAWAYVGIVALFAFAAVAGGGGEGVILLLAALALAVALTPPGRRLRREHRIPLPGGIILAASAIFLIAGMAQLGAGFSRKTEAEFARNGEQRLAQAAAALKAGDGKAAAEALEPIERAEDRRIRPFSLAAEALRDARGDKAAAVKALEGEYDEAEPETGAYLLAARAIDPELARSIEIASQKALQDSQEYDEVRKLFSAWNGQHPALVELVKSQMKNPRSFEHVETDVAPGKGELLNVRMTYRGTNGFGAVTTEQIAAVIDRKGNVVEILP